MIKEIRLWLFFKLMNTIYDLVPKDSTEIHEWILKMPIK